MINVICSAGGTLGHIMPSISFIKKLKQEQDVKIIYITTTKDKKYEVLSNNNLIDEIYYIPSCGIPKNVAKLLPRVFVNIKAMSKIKQIINTTDPRVVIGMGGYVSGLVIYVANKLKYKTIIHEQNSVLGFANSINLNKTNRVLTSYEYTYKLNNYLDKVKYIGNPRYDELRDFKKDLFCDKHNILFTSGTLGAKVINDYAVEFVNGPICSTYFVTIVTGKKYYDSVCERVIKRPNVKIIPFTKSIPTLLKTNGIIISRAGSSTLFEILATKTPSIIIPSKNVTMNHQYYNCLNFKKSGYIKLIKEDDLSYSVILSSIIDLTNRYEEYEERLNNLKLPNTLDEFYNIYKELEKE